MKKKLLSIIAVLGMAFLCGCASTVIKDSSLQKRTVSFSIGLDGIKFDKTTEGLAIGDATIIKEEDTQPTE